MVILMKLNHEKFEEVLARVILEVREASSAVKGARGVLGVLRLVPDVLRAVENIAGQTALLGEDKKAIAVHAILELVPDRWIADAILEPFVAFAVERVLQYLKFRGVLS